MELEEFKIENFKTDKNLFIEASAGTGKTYTIRKISAKLVRAGIPLSKILFLTYTEKAAGEMKDRVRAEMQECYDNATDIYEKKLFANALQMIDNTVIGTIHSFCQKTLHDFAYEANVAFNLENANDNLKNDLIDKMIRDNWRDSISDLDVKNVKSLLNSSLESWNPEIKFHTLDENSKEKKDEENFLVSKFCSQELPTLYKEWEKKKTESNTQTFNDMIFAVREAVCPHGKSLEEPTLLCKKLRENYKIAIIDEFQDTNQYQWDIFKTVFLESKENNIIVVGDPKQSIYSFQGADLNIYRKAIEQIGKENGKKLSINHRSSVATINTCNVLFKAKDFLPKDDFFDSLPPDEKKEQRKNALFNNKETKPIWIAPILPEKGFARFAIQKIIECCKIKNGKTALQVFDKGVSEPRNVKFSDFVILGRTRTELPEIKKSLTKTGIPFLLYKDNSLFNSRECEEWLSILKLLDINDFSGYNQKILNSALATDFFRFDLDDLENISIEEHSNEKHQIIENWHWLASKQYWAELHEQIYEDSQIELFLSEPSKLQELSKLRQIGNYIFNYLYEKKASLKEVIKHLNDLATKNKNAEDMDGDIVAKATDLDAVNLMTIHASKGLEFPVVISCAGLKGKNNNAKGPFLYEENSIKKLGFDSDAKKLRQKEELEEWHRLLYVAYTRASSLLILPQYENWFNAEKEKRKTKTVIKNGLKCRVIKRTENGEPEIKSNGEFSFLAHANNELIDTNSAELFNNWSNKEWNIKHFKKEVIKILNYSYTENNLSQTSADDESIYFENVQKLQSLIPSKTLTSHSASSLSHAGSSKEIFTIEGKPQNLSEESDDENEEHSIFAMNYPKGNKLGEAIHQIFEHLDFNEIGNCDFETIKANQDFSHLIETAFTGQFLPIHKNVSWTEKTKEMVWHTLNAKLLEIQGSKETLRSFQLKDLPKENRKPEMEFHFNAKTDENILKKFCKGFMDLVFIREINGKPVYSILDWKSNLLPDYHKTTIEKTVTEVYSIQLVLYAYCLIQWLRQFYSELSEEEIFENHFGGFYYVFVRGCKENTSNGIYAHTWNNYSELKKDYESIKKSFAV
ncbi:MAG: UvrD-helicase domain-containing protein [Fibrobacteraceae bacterium]|nr:UvrD-helicase domain-containing protein [Fibrobacteraceae bacterium]